MTARSRFDFVVVNPYHYANFLSRPAQQAQGSGGSMFKVVLLQLGAALVATALAAVFFGARGAVSAGLASAACIVPNLLFALRLMVVSRRGGEPSVAGFFVGEFIKVAAIVVSLVLIYLLYADLHWGALFIGLILVLKANLFAFLVKT